MVSVFQIHNLAHVGKPNFGCIHKGAFVLRLGGDGGGDDAVKLTPDTFGAEQAEVLGLFHKSFKISTLKITFDQMDEVFVIPGEICIVLHQVMIQQVFFITSPEAGVLMGYDMPRE